MGKKEKCRQQKRSIMYKTARITGVHKTGRQVAVANNICRISLWNLLQVTLLAPGILREQDIQGVTGGTDQTSGGCSLC